MIKIHPLAWLWLTAMYAAVFIALCILSATLADKLHDSGVQVATWKGRYQSSLRPCCKADNDGTITCVSLCEVTK